MPIYLPTPMTSVAQQQISKQELMHMAQPFGLSLISFLSKPTVSPRGMYVGLTDNANTYRYSTSGGRSHHHGVIGVAAGHSLCNSGEAGTACFLSRKYGKSTSRRAGRGSQKPISLSKNCPRYLIVVQIRNPQRGGPSTFPSRWYQAACHLLPATPLRIGVRSIVHGCPEPLYLLVISSRSTFDVDCSL
jgi:hypothetical protein